MPQTRTRPPPKRKRGRPAKNRIEQIDAAPEEIAQALVEAAERKGQQRRARKS